MAFQIAAAISSGAAAIENWFNSKPKSQVESTDEIWDEWLWKDELWTEETESV